MKFLWKKGLPLLLALTMVFNAVPVSVFASAEPIIGVEESDDIAVEEVVCDELPVSEAIDASVEETVSAGVFEDFFTVLTGVATVENSTAYPLTVSEDGGCLVTSCQGVNSGVSALTLTFQKPCVLSFDYRVSSEATYDYLTVQVNGTESAGKSFSGDQTEFSAFSVKASTGDVVTIGYKKDNSQNKFDDCVYLKNFSAHVLNTVTFSGIPENGELVVKDSANMETVVENGSIALDDGEYTYTATAFGYETVTGSFTVAGADQSVSLTMNRSASYAVKFELQGLAEGVVANIEVKHEDELMVPEEDGSYSLVDAEYSYVITAEGYKTVKSSFTVAGAAQTIAKTMETAVTFGQFVAPVSVYGDVENDSTYPFAVTEDGSELYSTNQKTSSLSGITVTFRTQAILNFHYRVNGGGYYDKLVVTKNGQQELSKSNGSEDDAHIQVSEGDVVKLSYNVGYTANSGTQGLYLSNFSVIPLYAIQFENAPEGAAITLTDGEGNTYEVTDGKAVVSAGTYHYTVTAFGYEEKSGDIQVSDQDVNQDVTMTALAGKKLTFQISGLAEGITPDITVTHEAGIFSPEADGSYNLVPADYQYKVKAAGYLTVRGTITIDDEDVTVPVAMTEGIQWDGDVASAFAGGEGTETAPYLIENGEQLAYLAQQVNGGNKYTGICFALKADIDMGGEVSFTPIGNSSGNAFAGCFDGKGNKIINLYVNSNNNYTGLFGNLGSGAVIRNLIVDGEISGKQYVGGIIGNAAGATIENCANYAAVTSSSTYAGGIVGRINGSSVTGGTILRCYNAGNINAGENNFAGGIAGQINYVTIRECYNTGTVASKRGGGICGQTASYDTVENCYNIGTVTLTVEGSYNYAAAIAGYSTGTIRNCWYLTGTTGIGSGTGTDMHEVSPEEMKSTNTVTGLGGSFLTDDKNLNQGYPVLAWQDPDAKLLVTFDVNYDDAVIEVKNADNQVMERQADGTYRLVSGSYTYNVSRTECETVSGSFEVAGSGKTIPVTLVIKTYPLTVSVNPADAAVVIKDSTEAVVKPGETGYQLPKGTYSYEVSKYGYVAEKGTLTITGNDDSLTLALETAPLYQVSFAITDKDTKEAVNNASVQVSHAAAGNIDAQTDGVYQLAAETFSYVIMAEGYINARGTFTVTGDNQVISVEMEQGSNVWTGEISETAPATETVGEKEYYLITSAEELAWFADQVTARGNTAINGKLMTNILLNSEEAATANSWTGIGSYSSQFTGTFDGNGKLIAGYYSTTTGLFTYMGEGSCVKHVTVAGSIAGAGTIGAVANQCYGTLEQCISRVDISGSYSSDVVAGGIAGRVYRTGAIIQCSNKGNIVQSTTGSYSNCKLGGIVGDAYCAISECSNYGTIETGSKGYIYIGGIIGYSNGNSSSEAGVQISDCYNRGRISCGAATNKPLLGGIAARHTMGASPALKNCYNVGSIESAAAASTSGAIAGDYNCNIENCYYLSGSAPSATGMEREGFMVEAVEKTQEEMQGRTFVMSLGVNTFGQAESDYPLLLWEGAIPVDTSEEAAAVAAAKSALVLENTTVLQAGAMNLPVTVEDFVGTITWSSDNTDLITNDGIAVLPENGVEYVHLTATLSLNGVQDTRTFVITVKSLEAQNQEILALAKEWADKTGSLTPVSGTDTNLGTYFHKLLAAQGMTESGNTRFSEIAVSVSDIGSRTYPSNIETDAGIGEDGTITYLYVDPEALTFVVNNAVISNVKLTLELGGQTVEIGKTVVLGWDAQRLNPYMENAAAAAAAAFDSYKNEEGTIVLDNDVKSLELPKTLEGYPYIHISWDSFDTLIEIADEKPGESTTTATIRVPEKDTEISLSLEVSFTCGDNVSLIKDNALTMTILAENLDDIRAEMQNQLDKNYTLEKLKDFTTGELLVPTAVMGDIQLPTPKNTGVENYSDYKFKVSSSDEAHISVNGYRANVFRPMPDEEAVSVTLTVTMEHRNKDVSVTKDLSVTVLPLVKEELDDAVALMDAVKAAYWDGINKGQNSSIYNVTASLSAFQEANLDEDGNVIFAYHIDDTRGTGIVPGDLADFSEVGGQEAYNKFKSSKPTVIAHENLILTQPVYNTSVTVESVLEHSLYADYARKITSGKWYDEYFSKLYQVPVSAVMTVIGTDGEDPNGDKPVTEVTVSVRMTGTNGVGAVDTTFQTTSDKTALEAIQQGLGEEYAITANSYGYIGTLTGPESFNQANASKSIIWGHFICSDGEYDTVSALTELVKDGAVYGIFAYDTTEDSDSYWGFQYPVWFADTTCSAVAGEPFTLQVYQMSSSSSGGALGWPGIHVYLDGKVVGTSDDNGRVTITLKKSGEQILTLGDSNHTYSQCKVTVAATEEEQAARVVDDLIDAIGEVTLESKAVIEAARDAYEKLTEEQKAFVTKLEVLEQAERAYQAKVQEEEKQKENEKAAKAVDDLIDVIGEVTLESKEAIEAARNAYEKLTEEQKILVAKLEVLEQAERAYQAKVQEEEKQKENEKAAKAVDDLIDVIGEVTLESKEAIEAARNAYEKLTEEQKALVTKLEVLEQAERAYQVKVEEEEKQQEGEKEKNQEITGVKELYKKAINKKSFTLKAKASTKVTYKTLTPAVAKVNQTTGKVKFLKIGTAKICITASGENYKTVTKIVKIRIRPKKQIIKVLKSRKAKTMTVRVRKDKKATGYQIQYSKTKRFKESEKIMSLKVKGKKKTVRTIGRLKSGKKYYVRVRSYKKKKNGIYYGAWSKVKKVTIK